VIDQAILTTVPRNAGTAKVAVGRFGVKGSKAFDENDQD
jgi:hypothetical protein